ncbi:MAG TPA: hypothetical protein VJH68_02095 [Candidatus Nanoarchaeia archaeon]|nr:hypothetical protein [Candidatus Nanoarchaeia archaeon]
MKGIFVHTTLDGKKGLRAIVESGIIGNHSNSLSLQLPSFKDQPLVFCSYVCNGYKGIYGNREGVVFETDSPIVYACPVDSFELMRARNWLPGHKQFIFSSIEKMLKQYPTALDFKKDFQEYFQRLKPKNVYPGFAADFAKQHYDADYCLYPDYLNRMPGCNEVTFPKPLKIRDSVIFNSEEELGRFF